MSQDFASVLQTRIIYHNFFPGSKNLNHQRQKLFQTSPSHDLFGCRVLVRAVAAVFTVCCLPGVRLPVNCLLVSHFISQWIKMQASGCVENWKMWGIFLVNFPYISNPVITQKNSPGFLAAVNLRPACETC